jgi:hypothetical protein
LKTIREKLMQYLMRIQKQYLSGSFFPERKNLIKKNYALAPLYYKIFAGVMIILKESF